MLSPDKCVLSNLNNIHVQNASTGVNVASHIVDVGAQLTQGETWGKLACKQCQDKRHNLPELDANCNNPSLQCKSCEAHSQQLLKLDFTNGENHMISDDFLLANSPTLAVSPSDFTISPLSSSISSCSDFESDATTNSICSKELPLSGQSNVPRSPDGQPDIIPLDENPDLSCSSEEKFQPACNSNKECSSSKPRGCINFVSLDDLESTLRSQKNKHNFFGVNSSTEQLDAMKGDNTVGQMIVSGPENPMNQSNLKIPAKNNNYEEIDCNSNTIANQQSANNESVLKIKSEEYYLNMKFVSKADQMAHKVQSKHSRSLADDKEAIGIKDETSANTGIQSKPFLLQQTASTIPHESEPRNGSTNNSFKQHMSLLGHQCKLNQNEPIKKNITSFHELAQKRKKSILGQASQVKSDKSDWLILFSPDTEFPPPNELTQTVFTQDQRKTPPEHGASAHREVTTFKELKYKNTMNKQNGQQGKSQVTWAQANASSINGAHLHHSKENLHEPMRNKEDSLKKATEEKPDEYKIKNGSKASANGGPLASDSDVLTQLKTHVGYYFESGPRRKSMSTLQPIVEGNSNEMEHSPAAEGSLVTNRRPGPGLEQEVCQGKSAYQVMNPTFRGKADGGDKDKREAGRSQSFTEPFRKGRIWMGSREWTLSQQAVPLVCLQQKRGLLNAVSSSVDKIVSHFSTTRNLVQKAQLGDSRISPEVGHLVLQGLCPALYAIVGDELKPYQNDLIVGRRKNSPWHVVEASVKPGPSTKSLYSLYCKIHQLSQLSNSKTRFNAFIFGLLNVKQLDFWISHLKKCTDVLAIHYSPTAFLSLTEKPFLHLFEELLLLLQPLSVFTFSLDLLFEYHHHFQVDERHLNRNVSILQNPRELCGCSPSRRKETDLPANSGPNHFDPVNENGGSEPRGNEDVRTVQDWSTKASHEGKASLFENEARGESGQLLALNGKPLLEQFEKALANGSLQTTLHQVRQWGDKLANTLMRNGSQPGGSFSSLDGHQGDTKSEQSPMTMKASKEAATGKKPASWWEQLSETSRVYVSPKQEGFLFAKWIRAKSPENANTCSAAIPGKHDNKKEADLVKRDQTSQQHPNSYGQMGNRLPNNPAKSSSIRQADSTSANGSTEQNGLQTSKEGTHSEAYPRRSPATEEPKERATQVNGNISCGAHDPRLTRSGSGSDTVGSEVKGEDESPTSKMWLGRLFGANSPSSKGSPDDPEMAYRPRRPSSWLAPNVNVFDFMHKGSASEKEKSSPPQPTGELSQSEEATKQLRAVKALCDHASAEEEHLSFKKGDVLQVLSSVDEDWIRCCHGDEVGLVPIGYTSIIL
ncbi:AP-4 complex accessory subunit RUSC1 [Latimeria chalumnae]|uniref:AP-4 complex accessory subunit RUSC1 n=1 Tax=Latimeria chalumnae TaxID=7897 RepID=UPI0006D90781|nr:PREDICTED: RUN and SH3 domain-containing protein 1 isoform X2 [Latimeria chalumnae]|eukprot:XP_006001696.2 PREDICTED: RUN and SH3 domain-containing protein 1 isoform X2 [Latimeria chalumnae]